MKVKELIQLLSRFDPESSLQLCLSSASSRVVSLQENLWLADCDGQPVLCVGPDVRHFQVYAGCGLEHLLRQAASGPQAAVTSKSAGALDLGAYDDDETANRVHDFYVYHRRLGERLRFPEFDYENWIPPRTRSGEYNLHIAEILREKLLKD